MHLYRFRLLYEEQEDFLRDYDILASQTFLDFHDIIKDTVELKGNELASFFICDRNWRKKKEITLINMNIDDAGEPDEDDDDERSGRTPKMPTFEMGTVKIKEIIDDPHQRLLFEYDFLNPKTFYIELIKIINADINESYPKCIKSVGKLLPAPLSSLPFISEDLNDIPLPGEFDEITETDDDDDIPLDSGSDIDKEW